MSSSGCNTGSSWALAIVTIFRSFRPDVGALLREKLLVRTVIVGLAMLLAGVLLTSWLMDGVSQEEHQRVVRDALARTYPPIWRYVAPSDVPWPLTERSYYDEFDRTIREEVLGHDLQRVKLWNRVGTVIYSTEASEIGESHPTNEGLRNAVRGVMTWKVTREPDSSFDGSRGLLEIYVPVSWPGSAEQAVLEVYVDNEPYANHLIGIARAILVAVGFASLVLPAALYFLYRGGWAAIRGERDRALEGERRELRLRLQLNGALDSVLAFVSRLMEEKESRTAGHSRTVATLAWACAARLGLPVAQQELARVAGLLHDVGKLAIATEMLTRPGPLTPGELAQMRLHAERGEQILASVPYLSDAAPAIRHHHERWDGRGYPDGLAGDDIPMLARIVTACDSYDAMTADRPYRPAKSPVEALAELEALAGTQFDPQVVAALCTVLTCAESAQWLETPDQHQVDLLALDSFAEDEAAGGTPTNNLLGASNEVREPEKASR